MSRRLGDDPLTRARSKRAKEVEGSTPVASAAGGEQSAAQVGTQAASRESYNDVFFQRRGEGIATPQGASDALVAHEAPEISEISEIPEIRNAAASGDRLAFDVTPDIKTASEVAKNTQTEPAPSVQIIEETVAKLSADISGTASPSGSVAEVKGVAASLTASSRAPASGGDEPKAASQKSGGFFKRLFGKFK